MSSTTFREQLARLFNKSEIKDLCFDLSIKYENLPGHTLDDKARELVAYCYRHKLANILIRRCEELRPHITWKNLLRNESGTWTSNFLVRQYHGHTYHVNGISVSNDGQYLATCGGDRKVLVWELQTASTKARFMHDSWVGAVAFDPNYPNLIMSDGKGNLTLWDFVAQKPIMNRVKAHNGPSRTVAFVPQTCWIASGGYDGFIRFWDRKNLMLIFSLPLHKSEIRRLAFSPNGLWMVSGDVDGFVHIYNVQSKAIVYTIENTQKMVRSLTYAANNNLVAITFDSGEVIVWDQQNSLTKWKTQAHDGHAIGVSFHPEKSLLATCGQDQLIKLWNGETGAFICSFADHTKTVTCLAFTPNGEGLLSGSRDESVKLWDVRDIAF